MNNTIEGLKKLAVILNDLFDKRDSIHSQIDDCYKPFKDIIGEVMIGEQTSPKLYVDNIVVGEDSVCFVIRNFMGMYDDEVTGTYKFPIEAFVSADTLRNHIAKGT